MADALPALACGQCRCDQAFRTDATLGGSWKGISGRQRSGSRPFGNRAWGRGCWRRTDPSRRLHRIYRRQRHRPQGGRGGSGATDSVFPGTGRKESHDRSQGCSIEGCGDGFAVGRIFQCRTDVHFGGARLRGIVHLRGVFADRCGGDKTTEAGLVAFLGSGCGKPDSHGSCRKGHGTH